MTKKSVLETTDRRVMEMNMMIDRWNHMVRLVSRLFLIFVIVECDMNHETRGGYVGYVDAHRTNDTSVSSDRTTVHPVEAPDTVYIKGIPVNAVNEESIVNVFSDAGDIVYIAKNGRPKIKIYYDRMTGEPRGDCTVTFVNEETAARAVALYHG